MNVQAYVGVVAGGVVDIDPDLSAVQVALVLVVSAVIVA